MLSLVACTAAPSGDLKFIQDDQYRIENPSRERAKATGIGCGETEKEAQGKAQRTAEFNLRSLTGSERYRVRFRALGRVPDADRMCWEEEAEAFPTSTR
jgi:hypothetical protein